MIEVVHLPVRHQPVYCTACKAPLIPGQRVERVSVKTDPPSPQVYYRCADRTACFDRLLADPEDDRRLG